VGCRGSRPITRNRTDIPRGESVPSNGGSRRSPHGADCEFSEADRRAQGRLKNAAFSLARPAKTRTRRKNSGRPALTSDQRQSGKRPPPGEELPSMTVVPSVSSKGACNRASSATLLGHDDDVSFLIDGDR